MTKVTILLCPLSILCQVHISQESADRCVEALPKYKNGGTFETPMTGQDAAEEAFDLTNNPSRQEEREEKYGRGRSVSSGDIIDVDGEKWLCMSVGWKKL